MTADTCPPAVAPPRPVPPLRRHVTGQACCRWASNGVRRTRYFGVFGTPEADAGYRAFAAKWSATPPPLADRPRRVEPPPKPPKGPPADPCRHCGAGKRCRPRGLCYPCHRDPSVRASYPADPRVSGGVGRANRADRPLPDRPTTVPPGPERVAVYAERAAAGRHLFHPRDVRD